MYHTDIAFGMRVLRTIELPALFGFYAGLGTSPFTLCALSFRDSFSNADFRIRHNLCPKKAGGFSITWHLPWWLEFALTVILLDLASYAFAFSVAPYHSALATSSLCTNTDQTSTSAPVSVTPLETIIAIMFSIVCYFCYPARPR
jgi:hypothetical protein